MARYSVATHVDHYTACGALMLADDGRRLLAQRALITESLPREAAPIRICFGNVLARSDLGSTLRRRAQHAVAVGNQ